MIDACVRGYQLVSMLEFIESPTFTSEQRRAIYAALPGDVSRDRSHYDEMKWYPAYPANELRKAIASIHGNDEKKVYDAIEGIGMFMADRATNTFLRLLMKILTPSLFAKKVPDFWTRDNRVGTMTVDTSRLNERRMEVIIRGIGHLDHMVPMSAGFAKFAMTAMGTKDVKIVSKGWSLGVPAPTDGFFEITWG